MPTEVCMTKEQIALGLKQGRILHQMEYCHSLEKKWIDELIEEGIASVSTWKLQKNGYWMRRIWKNEHSK